MIILLIFTTLSLDSILNKPEINPSYYGLYILRLDNNNIIYNYNGEKLFVPASNMKILTTAAVLCLLGPDFCYKTRLALRGKLKKNRLSGDVVIIGEGNPKFSLVDLEQFITTIKKFKIKEISGDIIVDDSYFTDEKLPVGWAWHYLDARYAPEISALSMNNNCVNVKIEACDVGNYARVSIEPETKYVKLISTMKTSGDTDSIIIYRKPEANIIYVDGWVKKGHTKNIEVAVKEPPLFIGEYFKERITNENIKLLGRVIKGRDIQFFASDTIPSLIFIDSVISVTLEDIIKETNTESMNLYAEILLKTLGAQKYNEGSFQAGCSALKVFLAMCGADTANVSLWDGSGLSKHNLISPHALVTVLKYMYTHKSFKKFYESFPKPGEGTLEERFNDFKDSLRAKTGALHAVSCLSGYLKVDGVDYCFSLMFNNFNCPLKSITKIQEEILAGLTTYLNERH